MQGGIKVGLLAAKARAKVLVARAQRNRSGSRARGGYFFHCPLVRRGQQ